MERLLSGSLTRPFVKAVGGDQAAMPLDKLSERGAFGDAFGAGIDHLICAFVILGPVGNQAPAHHRHVSDGPLTVLSNDGDGLAWRDVVTRSQLDFVFDFKALEKS